MLRLFSGVSETYSFLTDCYHKLHERFAISGLHIMDSLEKEQENFRMLWVIRESIQHNRVLPYFQEIHSNIPGKRRMFEALMRLTDEDGKLIFPDVFLPISKEFSLYDKLSEIMVDQALICEYVENQEIQEIMESLGVAYSQGYLFSKPHPWWPEDE